MGVAIPPFIMKKGQETRFKRGSHKEKFHEYPVLYVVQDLPKYNQVEVSKREDLANPFFVNIDDLEQEEDLPAVRIEEG